MLKEVYVSTKWNSKTKKYYEKKGYVFTFMGDIFLVDIYDLPLKSSEKVLVVCDYCQEDFLVTWAHRVKSFTDSPIKKDACTHCKHKKAKETMLLKYGKENLMQVEEFYKKQRNSCFNSLGFENPFSSKEIMDKISRNNYEKYGKKSYTQTEEYMEKRKNTCLEKYGYENHMLSEKYRNLFVGSKNPHWKGGINVDPRWERLTDAYKEWRFIIFEKSNFSCNKCGIKHKDIEAHHIYNWKDYPEKGYDLDNGITLCKKCHVEFHKIYGKKKNNPEQILEFLQQR